MNEAYTLNLNELRQRTDKILLTKKEAAEVLGISYNTLMARYGEYFQYGSISIGNLAKAITK
jgi:hypothetical protein